MKIRFMWVIGICIILTVTLGVNNPSPAQMNDKGNNNDADDMSVSNQTMAEPENDKMVIWLAPTGIQAGFRQRCSNSC